MEFDGLLESIKVRSLVIAEWKSDVKLFFLGARPLKFSF